MIKKFFILTLGLLSNGFVFAQSMPYLVIWTRNNERILYALDEKPVTKFSGTELVLSTRNLTVNYPLSELLRYTYTLNSSSIVEEEIDKHVDVSKNGGILSFSNLKIGTDIFIYSLDGSLLTSMKAKECTTVDLEGFPTGWYVIKVDNVTYKLMK